MKRILITGSRDWTNTNTIHRAVSEWVRDNVPQNEVTILVHGDASRGADRMARDLARAMWWLQEEAHPADWDGQGRAAGFIRNQLMVNLGADILLAFIRNNSKGATHTLNLAINSGIPVLVFREDD